MLRSSERSQGAAAITCRVLCHAKILRKCRNHLSLETTVCALSCVCCHAVELVAACRPNGRLGVTPVRLHLAAHLLRTIDVVRGCRRHRGANEAREAKYCSRLTAAAKAGGIRRGPVVEAAAARILLKNKPRPLLKFGRRSWQSSCSAGCALSAASARASGNMARQLM